jgi:hypothetical protein
MTFNREFLKELQQRLDGSDSYRITKQSVEFLLQSSLRNSDKNIIFDAIRNDTSRNEDELKLRQFWYENIDDSNLRF